MSEKICFVIQRYGKEVNGGAETHCRYLAERMKKYYSNVEVLTTKAIDYMTWKDEYNADEEYLNGVFIRRFSVEHIRDQHEFNIINAKFLNIGLSPREEYDWMEKQGPVVPGLIKYIKEHQADYKIIIFMTYLYYQTLWGIKALDDKTKIILLPLAHQEPPLRMKLFNTVFKRPNGFFFNTEEERLLVHERFNNANIENEIGGVGVDIPPMVDANLFKKKYSLEEYIIYVGRIDDGKNCSELFNFFLEYKKRNNNKLKLVLIGKNIIPIPNSPDILNLGFVNEQEKFDGLSGALALVLPSKYESLSMVVLEAMAVNTNVIVNGFCDVLRGHCIKSNGAFYYYNFFEWEKEINYLKMNQDIAAIMRRNAFKYVNENYQWERIIEKLNLLINSVCED